MPSTPIWRRAGVVFALTILCLIYLTALTSAGMVSTDEPRYAAIGKAMAQSGDWVTPRLWGRPWFEKPPLLYWMTASAFRVGLGVDLAPRLPVAMLSVGFVVFFYWIVRHEFTERAAWFSAAILATSVGWFAYSHIAVTDLPLAVCFSASMLLSISPGSRGRTVFAGLLLGLAILAKALVPLVLFLPAIWFLRRRPRDLAMILVLATFVALPWFFFCYRKNGQPFLDDLIWKQHFSRFTAPTLQHVQPFWYYIPVLLAGLFPWTAGLILLFKKSSYVHPPRMFLLAWLAFGLVFFSFSRNKLPGYLLPLLPALAILIGVALAEARNASLVLASTTVLIGFVPIIRSALPLALLSGVSRATFQVDPLAIVCTLLASILSFWLDYKGKRALAVALPTGMMILGYGAFLAQDLPVIDKIDSARPLWKQNANLTDVPRSLKYGICYYTDGQSSSCLED